MRKIIGLGIFLGTLFLVGCSPASITELPLADELSLTAASATATLPPTETATATITPSATATPTLSPTLTPSPTSTSTPSNTATRTWIPFTLTPSLTPTSTLPPDAPVFSGTYMYPFFLGDFLEMLRKAASNYAYFQTAMEGAVNNPDTVMSCSYYGNMRDIWLTKLRGFTEVPPEWYPAYYAYRADIQGVVNVTQPIQDVCIAGGGTISTETDWVIIDYLKGAVARTYALIAKVEAGVP